MMRAMIQDRLEYSHNLKAFEDYLSTAQSTVTEIDSLSTGHTAGHARTLMRRSKVSRARHLNELDIYTRYV